MTSSVVSYELEEGVALLRLDDGKANALGPAVIASLEQALDRAEKEAAAVLLTGREGMFSAGFDLQVMRQGGEAVRDLVRAGAELALRLYGFPRPVVAACGGHAIAMGALLLLACDLRLGARGAFKIGLNEVAIGMRLPHFGVELARDRLSKRHLTRAVLTSEPYDPERAVDAGFLDALADAEQLPQAARNEAKRLSALQPGGFGATKSTLRDEFIARVRGALDADMALLAGPQRGA